jgi:molybdate transport system ATP-binding protein
LIGHSSKPAAGWNTPIITIENMKPKPLITLDNITVRLQDRPYLQDTSWQINSNEHWAILGPNGSGKTTLAKSLFGEIPIVGGHIVFHFAKKDKKSRSAAANTVGYVSPELHRDIIERENLRDDFREFSGNIHEITTVKNLILNRISNADKAAPYMKVLARVAAQMGIEALLERDIKSLSIGEMNTVLIAKAMIKSPYLLILDEPFDGLDKQSRLSLADTINDLMRANIQVILITHRFEEITPNITHVLLLKYGKIFKSGRKEQVFTPENINRVYEIDRRPVQDIPQKLGDALAAIKAKGLQPVRNEKMAAVRVLIEMRDVTVKYNQSRVLDKFSWIVNEGENWTIMGPKGSGKSTVLTLILGDNLQAYANEIYLFGKKRGSGESIWDIKKQIGCISSDLQIRQHKNIKAFDVVCSGFFDSNGLYRKCSPQELSLAREWTHFLDVSGLADQNFGRLSHGQRQLILIARAMVKAPKILILDEPFQGLDIKNRSKIMGVLEYIGSHTATNLIYVPNREEEGLSCITHILDMDRGRVVRTRSVNS